MIGNVLFVAMAWLTVARPRARSCFGQVIFMAIGFLSGMLRTIEETIRWKYHTNSLFSVRFQHSLCYSEGAKIQHEFQLELRDLFRVEQSWESPPELEVEYTAKEGADVDMSDGIARFEWLEVGSYPNIIPAQFDGDLH
jgi:hypothetical protein